MPYANSLPCQHEIGTSHKGRMPPALTQSTRESTGDGILSVENTDAYGEIEAGIESGKVPNSSRIESSFEETNEQAQGNHLAYVRGWCQSIGIPCVTTSLALTTTVNKGLSDSDSSPRHLIDQWLAHDSREDKTAPGRAVGEKRTIRNGIQCLGPTYRPRAAEIGWKITKVMKNKEVA